MGEKAWSFGATERERRVCSGEPSGLCSGAVHGVAAAKTAGDFIAREAAELADAFEAGRHEEIAPLLNSLAGWAEALHDAAFTALWALDSKEDVR